MRKYLRYIRALPEEVRKLLAVLSMIIIVIVFLGNWGDLLSYRVQEVALNAAGTDETTDSGVKTDTDVPDTAGNETLSPFAGLINTARDLKSLFPEAHSSGGDKETNILQKGLTGLKEGFSVIASKLFDW